MWKSVASPAPPKGTPPSPAPPPKQSKYHSARQAELEQLQQRGLAKLLNKHFTSVTQTIAEERAAADAALRDLEERKAAGLKDWGDANNSGQSIWENLYKELQQKKAECRRKERETLLLYQRYVAKFGGTGAVGLPGTPSKATPQPPLLDHERAPSTPSRVSFMADQIESSLNQHVSSGAERHPSIKFLGVNGTHQQLFSAMDEETRIHHLRALEGKGVDAVASMPAPLPPRQPKKGAASAARVGIPDTPPYSKDSVSFTSLSGENGTPGGRSQLTTTTTSSAETGGEDSPVPTEPEASTTLVIDPDDMVSSGTHDHIEEDDDIKSSISGLTSAHSLIMSVAENRLIEFLQSESEAIRQILDDEERTMTSAVSGYDSAAGSQALMAANYAEDMVTQMQKILEHYQDQGSVSQDSVDTPSREPRAYHTGNPNEQWMVYYDESCDRNYYHDHKSNRTQWTAPDEVSVSDFSSSGKRSVHLSHLEVMPERVAKNDRISRRESYRRARRRRRNRKRALIAAAALCAVSGGIYVTQYRPEIVEQVVTQVRSYIPDPVGAEEKARHKAAEQEMEMKERAARSRKAKEEARKQKEEAERKSREDIERIAREIVRSQEEARQEAERLKAEREQQLVVSEVEKKKDARKRRIKSIIEVMLQAPRPL